jgi:hypothetical protein
LKITDGKKEDSGLMSKESDLEGFKA